MCSQCASERGCHASLCVPSDVRVFLDVTLLLGRREAVAQIVRCLAVGAQGIYI